MGFNLLCCEFTKCSTVALSIYFFSESLMILEWYWVGLGPNRFASFHHLDGAWVAFPFVAATKKELLMCLEYSE
jgi:hypothetical protein